MHSTHQWAFTHKNVKFYKYSQCLVSTYIKQILVILTLRYLLMVGARPESAVLRLA